MALRKRKKRLVLGVTGSIASYKAAELARYFMKRGYDVRVVMSDSATKFIAPLTFESLTGNPVNTGFWGETVPGAIGHIELADWADVVLVAPASADFIAKANWGAADSTVLAVVLATKAPVVVAPAMNVNMYEHPQTQENLDSLRGRGVVVVDPVMGQLACGWVGSGRLAEPHEIFAQVERAIAPADLVGQRVLISAGPTREAIDPVRFLSNRSSGKMGFALAREAYRRGAVVTLVCGPVGPLPKLPHGIEVVSVTTAKDMLSAMSSRSPVSDIVVMAAAVADFRPSEEATNKIKKGAQGHVPELDLVANPDVLKSVSELRGSSAKPVLVGFAVETDGVDALLAEARAKLDRKGLDLVVGNLASEAFDRDTNQVWIVSGDGATTHIPPRTKRRVAQGVWDQVVRLRLKG